MNEPFGYPQNCEKQLRDRRICKAMLEPRSRKRLATLMKWENDTCSGRFRRTVLANGIKLSPVGNPPRK